MSWFLVLVSSFSVQHFSSPSCFFPLSCRLLKYRFGRFLLTRLPMHLILGLFSPEFRVAIGLRKRRSFFWFERFAYFYDKKWGMWVKEEVFFLKFFFKKKSITWLIFSSLIFLFFFGLCPPPGRRLLIFLFFCNITKKGSISSSRDITSIRKQVISLRRFFILFVQYTCGFQKEMS